MPVKLSAWLEKNVKRKQMFLLLAADIIILAVMSFVLIPVICETTPGMTIFDLKAMGYDLNYVNSFIGAMSERGREVYLKGELALDLIYPLVYTLLYLAVANKVFKKRNIFVFMSIMILCVSDYVENILSYVMLLSNNLSAFTVGIASAATSVKSIFLYIVWLSLAGGAVYGYIRKRRRIGKD